MDAGEVMNSSGQPLRPLSQRRYRDELRRVVLPRIGDDLLADLEEDSARVEDLIATRPNATAESATATVLAALFRWCSERPRRWIRTNPAHGLQRRINRREILATQVLDLSEMQRLLGVALGSDLEPAIVLGAAAGLRIGEVASMTWAGIDLPSRKITVSGNGHGGPTKSGTGSRTFSLTTYAAERLIECKQRQAEHLQRLGLPQDPTIAVVTRPSGAAWNPKRLGEAFQTWRDEAGFPGLRFHALRHSCATLMLVSGTDPRTVAGVLGDSMSTIQTTYAHFIPVADEMAAQRLDALLRSEGVVELPLAR
jgi:integrase